MTIIFVNFVFQMEQLQYYVQCTDRGLSSLYHETFSLMRPSNPPNRSPPKSFQNKVFESLMIPFVKSAVLYYHQPSYNVDSAEEWSVLKSYRVSRLCICNHLGLLHCCESCGFRVLQSVSILITTQVVTRVMLITLTWRECHSDREQKKAVMVSCCCHVDLLVSFETPYF